MDAILDKLERGELPTKAELKEAGLCLTCGGFGFLYDDKDEKCACKKCDGDGLARVRKT